MKYVKLCIRSVVFITLLVFYILYRTRGGEDLVQIMESHPIIMIGLWVVFVVKMTLRFFPSRFESRGCQKHLARNFIDTGKTDIVIEDNHAVPLVTIAWIVPNLIFGILHMTGIFDDGIMLLICSAYSVGDMICVLFFCPFQEVFLKNRCCTTCRIYNWDYVFLFTPLIFIPRIYTWSLVALSFATLIHWEIAYHRHPERFSRETNGFLQCKNCTEKTCKKRKRFNDAWESHTHRLRFNLPNSPKRFKKH